MSVATDDVHDLFGLDDDGESDDPSEEPDGSADSVPEPDEGYEEADGAAEWPEFPSLEDDESVASADPASEETAESTTVSSAEAVEGDADEFESTESTMSFEGSADGDADEFEADPSTTPSEGSVEDAADASDSSESPTMFSEGAAEDDVAGSEPATTPAGEATEDDADEDDADEDAAGEVEPAASATSADLSVEDDAVESETADPATTSSEWTVEDDTEESAPAASTTSPQDDAEESEPAGSPSPSQGTAEDDSGEAGATTPPGEAAAGERDESEPERATASADATTADDQGTAASGGTTTATDGSPVGGATAHGPATGRPTVDGHDELETASPDAPESVASGVTVSSGTTVDEGVAATSSGSNRLPTGIDELDRAMGGGVPPGRLVVLVADPGVQSELIVDSVLAQRDTLFVTTDRPDWEVMKDIEPGLGSGEVVIRDHTPDSLLSGLDSLLDELGTSSNFVIDSVNELELLPRKRYRIFLSDVKRRLFDTGSVGLFTGVTVGHESARDLTLRRADIVWRLETRTTDREIENRLSVPKFRGGAALTETVKLELTDEVRVDTSWNDG